MDKIIFIGSGKGKSKKKYYYFETFDSWEDAKREGEDIKENRKEEKIKYFILQTQDSWFLPVDKYILYLTKKLKIW